MKWAAVGLILFGVLLFFRCIRSRSSFEDGSFMLTIYGASLGAIMTISGVIWIAILLFMGIG